MEKPPLPKTREELEHDQDMKEANSGLDLLTRMKRIKAEARLAEIEARRREVLIGLTPRVDIPSFDSQSGASLTPEQKIAWVRKNSPETNIPNFDDKDGHELSPEEQLKKITGE